MARKTDDATPETEATQATNGAIQTDPPAETGATSSAPETPPATEAEKYDHFVYVADEGGLLTVNRPDGTTELLELAPREPYKPGADGEIDYGHKPRRRVYATGSEPGQIPADLAKQMVRRGQLTPATAGGKVKPTEGAAA